MPNEGDKPGPCCEAMAAACKDEGFSIEWRVDEYNQLKDDEYFTGFSMVLTHYGWYPGERDDYYAPVKFCPFCGAELITGE